MTIYAQPNSWQCGPFALKHGLLALGIHAHEDALARLAGSTEQSGTDDRQLARAASAHGCTLSVARRAHGWAARHELRRCFARAVPVLLCLDQWEHWVTVVSADAHDVVVFDSQFDNAVIRLEPWERVIERLVYRKRRWRGVWTQRLYDLHPLETRVGGPRLRLTPEGVRRLLATEDGPIIDRWDEYARRLLPLAAPAGRSGHLAPLTSFLTAHADRIVAEVARGRGASLGPSAEREVRRLALAAELYDLRLRPMLLRRVIVRLAGVVSGFLPARPMRLERRPAARVLGVTAASA
jgi:hypothetical protein